MKALGVLNRTGVLPVPLLFAMSLALPATAQDRDPRALIEEFEETGSIGILTGSLGTCGSEDSNAEELTGLVLSRPWSDQRTREISAVFSAISWDECPDGRIDDWLLARFRESVDDPGLTSTLLWQAILARDAPRLDAQLLSLSTESQLPHEVRSSALSAYRAEMTPGERVAVLLQNLGRTDLPRGYFGQEAGWLAARHPETLLSALDAPTLANLPEEGGRAVILSIGTLAAGGTGAGPAARSRARGLLESANDVAGADGHAGLIERTLERATILPER